MDSLDLSMFVLSQVLFIVACCFNIYVTWILRRMTKSLSSNLKRTSRLVALVGRMESLMVSPPPPGEKSIESGSSDLKFSSGGSSHKCI